MEISTGPRPTNVHIRFVPPAAKERTTSSDTSEIFIHDRRLANVVFMVDDGESMDLGLSHVRTRYPCPFHGGGHGIQNLNPASQDVFTSLRRTFTSWWHEWVDLWDHIWTRSPPAISRPRPFSHGERRGPGAWPRRGVSRKISPACFSTPWRLRRHFSTRCRLLLTLKKADGDPRRSQPYRSDLLCNHLSKLWLPLQQDLYLVLISHSVGV